MTVETNKTTSQVDLEFRKATCISTGVFSIFLAVFTAGGNGFLLYVLYKDPLKVLRRPVTVFIGALAVVDFLTGLISDFSFAALQIDCFLGETNDPGGLGSFSGIVYFFTITSSSLLVAALSVERFIGVAFPYYYRSSITVKKILIVVGIIYTHSFVFAMLQLAHIPGKVYHNIDLHLHITFPVVTIAITYTAIYFIMRQRRKISSNLNTAPVSQANAENSHTRREARNVKIEHQLISTAFIILLCMVISLIPYFVIMYVEIECSSCIDTKLFFIGRRLSVPILFISSAVNPLLYALRIQHYRQSFRAVLRLANSGPEVSEPNIP